ncbi:MAG: hypothetical protein C0518_05415 [Opitutus sp.]|nr:hypothetical protein [Opitutus sp.]
MSGLQKFMELGHNATFVDGLQALKETGGAVVKIVVSGKDEHPVAAMIIVRGKDEATEVVRAVDSIEKRWDSEVPYPAEWFFVFDRDGLPLAGFPERGAADAYADGCDWIILAARELPQPKAIGGAS